DATAELLQREREIHADGGLPHAALAAAHRDDVPDSWQLFRTGGRLLGRRVWRVVVVVVWTGGLHASSFLSFWPRDAVVPTSRPRCRCPSRGRRSARRLAGPADQRPPLSERRTSRRARWQVTSWPEISPSAKGPPLCVH